MKSREAERLAMVEQHLAARDISDPRLLDAFRTVPRERFVPPSFASSAYEDRALPIAAGQTISQPYMVAFMLNALELTGEERVLEIGTGSGYAAAILSQVAREVISIERVPSLATAARLRIGKLGITNVRVLDGDGTLGCAAEAPFDAIVVAAAAESIPQVLVSQLRIGGRLVLPVRHDPDLQMLKLVTRVREDAVEEKDLGLCAFVPLIPGPA
jgi:protein-L-isoaspartate(D-aspartate) O-methyltransferase